MRQEPGAGAAGRAALLHRNRNDGSDPAEGGARASPRCDPGGLTGSEVRWLGVGVALRPIPHRCGGAPGHREREAPGGGAVRTRGGGGRKPPGGEGRYGKSADEELGRSCSALGLPGSSGSRRLWLRPGRAGLSDSAWGARLRQLRPGVAPLQR